MFISTVSRRGPASRKKHIMGGNTEACFSCFFPTFGMNPFICTLMCSHTHTHTHTCIYTTLSKTLERGIICNCEYVHFSLQETPTSFVRVVKLCAHVLCVYLSLGRCPLTWPVTGQSLRTLPYCTPQGGLERGHQRLKEVEEEEYRGGGGRTSREGGGSE